MMRQIGLWQLVFVLCLPASACFGASQRRCPSCGELQESGNLFCIQCGTNMTQKAEVAPKPKSSQSSVTWSPIGLELVPNAGFPASSADIYGLDLGALGTRRDNMIGVQLGVFLSEARSLWGASIGGFVAKVDNGCGILMGGLSSWVTTFYGLQIAPYLNSATDGAFVQLGLINEAGKATCLQIGFANIANDGATCLQIGGINVVHDGSGKETVFPFLHVHW